MGRAAGRHSPRLPSPRATPTTRHLNSQVPPSNERNAMRSLRPLILTCVAICVWTQARPGRAQDVPLNLYPIAIDPLAFVTDGSTPLLQPAVLPSGPFLLATPATQPIPKDQYEPSEAPVYACACGCGVFEVATSSMLPHGQGGMAWEEFDNQDQNGNRHGTSAAPAADNDDKEISTDFFDTGFEYFFNRKWGVQVEVPIDYRHFATGDGSFNWTALGDIRVKGLYAGFFDDQSVGIEFGAKLATGNFTQPGPDRDTQLGTGSTDLLLGGFVRTNLSADNKWNLFSQVEGDLPVLIQDQYRPGFEADGAAGIYYSGFSFHNVTMSPVGQVILSYRSSDTGANSSQPIASGYQRVLLSPGIEFDFHPFTIYGDVEFPVFQYFRGDQLAAPAMFKLIFSYHF
jgi:hypothetical protein